MNLDFFEIRKNAIFRSHDEIPHYTFDPSYTELQQDEENYLIENLWEEFVYPVWRDFLNTFQPYSRKTKGVLQKEEEKYLPWLGVKNTMKGIAGLIAIPFLLLRDVIRSCIQATSFFNAVENLVLSFSLGVARLANCAAYLARGATQLAATFLNWVIKMPLRMLLSISKVREYLNGWGPVERRYSVVEELEDARDCLMKPEEAKNSYLHGIIKNLHAQYKSALKNKKQYTSVSSLSEKKYFDYFNAVYRKHNASSLNISVYGLEPKIAAAALHYFGLYNYKNLKPTTQKSVPKTVDEISASNSTPQKKIP